MMPLVSKYSPFRSQMEFQGNALLGSEHHRGVICDIFMVAIDGQAKSSPLRDPRLLAQTPPGRGASVKARPCTSNAYLA